MKPKSTTGRRKCLVCGRIVTPFRHKDGKLVRMTAHEYNCFKKDPAKVPTRLQPDFEQTKAWEKRSRAARKRGSAHA